MKKIMVALVLTALFVSCSNPMADLDSKTFEEVSSPYTIEYGTPTSINTVYDFVYWKYSTDISTTEIMFVDYGDAGWEVGKESVYQTFEQITFGLDTPEDITSYSSGGYCSETWMYYSKGIAYTFSSTPSSYGWTMSTYTFTPIN